jgi:WD40 repeat protein
MPDVTAQWWVERNGPRERILSADLGDFTPKTVTVAEADGRTLLILGGESDDRLPIRTVDLETGTPLPDRALVHGHRSPDAIALGRCGDRVLLATGTRRGSVRVRDAVTGHPVGVEITHERTGVSVAVATVDGEDVVAVAGSAWIKVWRLSDGTQLAGRGYKDVRFVAHGGRLLAVKAKAGIVHETRDVLTGKVVAPEFPVPNDVVWTLTGRDGRLLAVGVHAGTITQTWAWDVLAGTPVTLPPLLGPDSLDEAADTVATIAVDGAATLVTWRTKDYGTGRDLLYDGRRVPLGPEPAGPEIALGGGLIAEAGFGNALSVRVASTGAPVETPYYGGEVGPPLGAGLRDGRLVTVLPGEPRRFFDDEGSLVTRPGGEMMIWDVADGRPVARVAADIAVQCAAVGDGTIALLHPEDGETPRLRLVDLATGHTRADVPLAPTYAALLKPPVFLTRGGRSVVAVAGADIALYDAVTGDRVDGVTFDLEHISGCVLAAGRVGDREVLAGGGSFSPLVLWDAETGAELRRLDCDGIGVSALAFGDHHGRPILVTATERYSHLQAWDAATGRRIGRSVDIGRRVPTMVITSLRVARRQGETVVLSAAEGWPPHMWIIKR